MRLWYLRFPMYSRICFSRPSKTSQSFFWSIDEQIESLLVALLALFFFNSPSSPVVLLLLNLIFSGAKKHGLYFTIERTQFPEKKVKRNVTATAIALVCSVNRRSIHVARKKCISTREASKGGNMSKDIKCVQFAAMKFSNH